MEKISDMSLVILRSAIEHDDVNTVRDFVSRGEVNVNDIFHDGNSLLGESCFYNSYKVTAYLLGHPDIRANEREYPYDSAFYTALEHGPRHSLEFSDNLQRWTQNSESSLMLLITSPKVDVNLPERHGKHPLEIMCSYVDTHSSLYPMKISYAMKIWIASGRPVYLRDSPDDEPGVVQSIREGAKTLSQTGKKIIKDAATLLRKYIKNRGQTVQDVRLEVGWTYLNVYDVFALVVFHSDDMLKIGRKGGNQPSSQMAKRFFKVTVQLPLEIQMIVCFYAMGIRRSIILSRDSDFAFRNLAGDYLRFPSRRK